MASDTDTARADPPPARGRRGWRFRGSRLGALILALNLLGLTVLVAGALVLNELRRGLVETRLEHLSVQGELIANLIAETATRGSPEPALEPAVAALLLQKNFVPRGQRVRLFDDHGVLVADSYLFSDAVEETELPPARRPGGPAAPPRRDAEAARAAEASRRELEREVSLALEGGAVAAVRRAETGDRVVSVSMPIRRVQAVLGVVTLEAGDVEAIVSAQRMALAPYAVVAVLVTLLSSFMLHLLVARPILRLSAAADQVRLQRARAISFPDLEERRDEIGDLARSLETMTRALTDRVDAIERFAADVSHEIKNPLTSIRSALETLPLARDETAKARLTQVIMHDVKRLDRLITDISNASRLDAEMSREPPRRLDLRRVLGDIVDIYAQTRRPGAAEVVLHDEALGKLLVLGREGPLGQVFRNLIDNALSFSPEGGGVRVFVERVEDPLRPIRVRVEDDGPGIPPENLETVFQRFYTSRPKGAAFGGNSGLGLSIARQIVDTQGGALWAENRAGPDGEITGARFVAAFPEAPS